MTIHQSDTQSDPIVTGDVISTQIGDQANVVAVGKNITQVVYQQVTPPRLDAATVAAANARLAQLPLDTIPPIATLPTGSRIPYGVNPLFVGREAELLTLAAQLKGGETIAIGQIAAATGLGGIGKTQLAVAFVHHYGQFFAGGVQWLSFADPDAIPAEIVACGGVMTELRADYATLDLESQVRLVLAAWQSPLPRLLVFDNCEEPALLAQWRPPTGGSRVLVTSRRRSWDAGLGVQLLALDTLPRAQSIELLRKFRPDLAASDPELEQIAAELGDLPLALHLAGGYLARYSQEVSPASYLAKLQQPDLLAHRSLQMGDLSPTGHVQHVARTFALSYEQLHPDNSQDVLALALLARAAWFAAGQPIPRSLLLASSELADAEEAALQAADALEQLANLGLLEMTANGDLLIHRLVAHFVQRADAELSEVAQRAVAAALLTEAERINNAGVPGPLLTWQSHLRQITDLVQGQAATPAAGLCNALGVHLYMIGNYGGARPYFERALAIREQVLGPQHADTALILNNLGALLQAEGNYASAKFYYEHALSIAEAVLGHEHPDIASGYNNLGNLLVELGDYAAAKLYLEQSVAITEAVLGQEHPDTASGYNSLGNLHIELGDYTAAKLYLERSVAIIEAVLGQEHPDIAHGYNNLGSLHHYMGDYPVAKTYFERSLAVIKAMLGQEHIDTAHSYNNLGRVLYAMEDYEAAKSNFEQALAIRESVLGRDHPTTAISYTNLGKLLQHMGNYVAAQPYFEQALTIREAVLGAKHSDTANSYNNLGMLLQDLGDLATAQPYFEQALAIYEKSLGMNHPHTQTVRDNLAILQQALKA